VKLGRNTRRLCEISDRCGKGLKWEIKSEKVKVPRVRKKKGFLGSASFSTHLLLFTPPFSFYYYR